MEKEITKEELVVLMARRLKHGAGLDEYYAQQAAEYLIETKTVTPETMFAAPADQTKGDEK